MLALPTMQTSALLPKQPLTSLTGLLLGAESLQDVPEARIVEVQERDPQNKKGRVWDLGFFPSYLRFQGLG